MHDRPTAALLATVLVEPPGKSVTAMPMIFDVIDRTLLFREYAGLGDKTRSEINVSALTTGMIARIGYSGPVRESYPAQATAAYVVLEDPGS